MKARTSLAYLAVAGWCLVLHNVILIAAHFLAVPLWLAILISFAAVVVTGYGLHAFLTFRQRLSLSAFARYAIAMSGNIPLAYLATWFWYAAVKLPMPLAAPIASVCMIAVNFLLSRWAILTPGRAAAPHSS